MKRGGSKDSSSQVEFGSFFFGLIERLRSRSAVSEEPSLAVICVLCAFAAQGVFWSALADHQEPIVFPRAQNLT